MSLARSLPRWGISLLLVLGLHIGVVLWSLYWQPQAAPLELPPPAMLIELPPAPPAAPAAPPPPPEPVRAPEPPPQPKVIEAPKPKLALPPPPPKPRPKPPKPEPKPEPKPRPRPPVEPPPSSAPVSDSVPVPNAKPAARPSPQAGNPAPSQAKASWQSRLLAHLNRYKRYPEDARRRGQQGVVKLRFVVDARGQVQSFELAARSGNPSLDRATLQMIRRAQPLPAPPPELLQNGRLEVVAPFVYSLERR
ncbi:protein TonB [Pseudomonas linyingensis]|uniref:Protein TonB n=1 Tax=Pseudomonas linyingensis TaxID=915471 RepID=A0A1H7B8X4_9PSED|nr:energy transducer TonB [Pseudomonas linyingensis]SEJ74201.1 protein TonB [Pseudomonas linyingensis]